MTWKEIKSWAKQQGYEVFKDKQTNEYYWSQTDNLDHNASGVEPSVSKLAKSIYNHITDNEWLDYQKEYIKEKYDL
jgi:hypothetical protein